MKRKSGQLKDLTEAIHYNTETMFARRDGNCVSTLACEKCFALITDSICLCAGLDECPECKPINKSEVVKKLKKIQEEMNNYHVGMYSDDSLEFLNGQESGFSIASSKIDGLIAEIE